MINSYEPTECPYCLCDKFIRKGFDTNGIRRYKCLSCGQTFKPTTGTIFGSRKISLSEWIDYCLNIFRYISLNADSWNNRNAMSTSKYFDLWVELQNGEKRSKIIVASRRPIRRNEVAEDENSNDSENHG